MEFKVCAINEFTFGQVEVPQVLDLIGRDVAVVVPALAVGGEAVGVLNPQVEALRIFFKKI